MGCFPEPRNIGAGVHSLTWISSAPMTLPNSCLWSLWNIHFALVIQTSYVLIFPDIAKTDFSCHIILLLYRVHFRNAFQEMETACHKPELREEEAGHWCLCHNDRRHLYGKEARVAFLIKDALGMESIYWGGCMKQPGCFQCFVFWRFFMAILPCLYELAMFCL